MTLSEKHGLSLVAKWCFPVVQRYRIMFLRIARLTKRLNILDEIGRSVPRDRYNMVAREFVFNSTAYTPMMEFSTKSTPFCHCMASFETSNLQLSSPASLVPCFWVLLIAKTFFLTYFCSVIPVISLGSFTGSILFFLRCWMVKTILLGLLASDLIVTFLLLCKNSFSVVSIALLVLRKNPTLFHSVVCTFPRANLLAVLSTIRRSRATLGFCEWHCVSPFLTSLRSVRGSSAGKALFSDCRIKAVLFPTDILTSPGGVN